MVSKLGKHHQGTPIKLYITCQAVRKSVRMKMGSRMVQIHIMELTLLQGYNSLSKCSSSIVCTQKCRHYHATVLPLHYQRSVELLFDILSTGELDNENFSGDSDSDELIQRSGMTILTINEVQYSYSYRK